jgi:hypothetical protein
MSRSESSTAASAAESVSVATSHISLTESRITSWYSSPGSKPTDCDVNYPNSVTSLKPDGSRSSRSTGCHLASYGLSSCAISRRWSMEGGNSAPDNVETLPNYLLAMYAALCTAPLSALKLLTDRPAFKIPALFRIFYPLQCFRESAPMGDRVASRQSSQSWHRSSPFDLGLSL